MSLKSKLKKATMISLTKYIYFNYLCRQVTRTNGAKIIPYRGTHISIAKSAHLDLNADMELNGSRLRGSKQECLVLMREGSTLTVNGKVFLYYGTTLQVHKDAQCTLGESRFNTGSTIICAYRMTIGDGVSAARNVFIFDSDHHPIFNADGKRINDAKEVVIGNNVWMGLKSTIMKGAHIADGTVVGAHSLVSGDMPGHAMVATAPARPVMKDISWHR